MEKTPVAGDRIVVDSHRVGGGRREGEILEVIEAGETTRLRVQWDDGKESVFVPGSDAHVEHVLLPAERP